jgi:hypothetical protein
VKLWVRIFWSRGSWARKEVRSRIDLEGALAVVAAEAGAVVGSAVGGELLDRVDGLPAGRALLLRAAP